MKQLSSLFLLQNPPHASHILLLSLVFEPAQSGFLK